MFKSKLIVKFKQGILDPQGNTLKTALKNLGFSGVNAVRVGKFIEIDLEAESVEDAKEKLKQMCEKLLANPITEDYEILSLEEFT